MNDKQFLEKNQDKFLERPTEKKKLIPEFLKLMKGKVSNSAMSRIEYCASTVAFLKSKGEKIRLAGGEFCHNRFCPFCSWKKAKKDGYLLLLLFSIVQKIYKKELIFLTLTAPNVSSEKLDDEIKDFNKAFERLSKTLAFKKINKGYIRKLEVTYNSERNDYHPHFHVVIAVNKSYFKSRYYLNPEKWLNMWQLAKRDTSITQVDIRKAKLDDMKAVYEMATYSAKASDYMYSEEVFDVFYNSLKRKKLITFNGLFKEILKDIKNTDKYDDMMNDETIYDKLDWYKYFDDKYNLHRSDLLSEDELKKIDKNEIDID